MSPAPTLRPPPPARSGRGPPLAAALLLHLRGALWPAGLVLAGAVLVVVILELIASQLRSRGTRQPGLEPLMEASVALVRLVSLAVSSLESMIAAGIGLSAGASLPFLVGAGLLLLLWAAASGVRRISAALAAVRASGHGEQVKGYGAMFYRNPEDPRLWVPKLFGVGQTLNMAHRASWWIFAAVLAVPALAVALVLLLAPRR